MSTMDHSAKKQIMSRIPAPEFTLGSRTLEILTEKPMFTKCMPTLLREVMLVLKPTS